MPRVWFNSRQSGKVRGGKGGGQLIGGAKKNMVLIFQKTQVLSFYDAVLIFSAQDSQNHHYLFALLDEANLSYIGKEVSFAECRQFQLGQIDLRSLFLNNPHQFIKGSFETVTHFKTEELDQVSEAMLPAPGLFLSSVQGAEL